MFKKITGADPVVLQLNFSNPSDFGTTWSLFLQQTELNNATPMKELRRQRDAKLQNVIGGVHQTTP